MMPYQDPPKQINKYTEANTMYWLLLIIIQLLVGLFCTLGVKLLLDEFNWIGMIGNFALCGLALLMAEIFDPSHIIPKNIKGINIWDDYSTSN